MKSKRYTILILLLALIGSTGFAAPTQAKTYSQTRKLLIKVERSPANDALKNLFENVDKRREDLIQALYDPEQKVSLNAQLILRYLGGQKEIAAIEEWYAYMRKHKQDYWMAPVEIISDVRYLEGSGNDLAKLVLKNLHLESKDVSARVVANNKSRKTVLVEVIIGNVFTEGLHIVIKEENGRWRLVSNSLVWQS